MLALTEHTNRQTKSYIDERDDHRIRIPWLNFLTAQSIPEEMETFDYSKRQHTDSGCSTSSSEDSYVVLDVQRPKLIIIEQELNFENVHNVEFDQIARSMIIEIPAQENAIEYSLEPMIDHKQFVTVTQIFFQTSIEHQLPRNHDNPPPSSTFSHPSKPIGEATTFTRTFAFDQACMRKLHNVDQSSGLASKPPVLLRLLKRHSRNIKSEYYPSPNEKPTDEPSLLQMKYLDGRPALTDLNALNSSEKTPRSDLSYYKRIVNRLQTFLKSSPAESSKPWQRKTLLELFHERKTKISRV